MAASPSSGAARSPRSPIRSIRSMRWAGMATLSVVRINVRDLRPLMSHRYHLPPSAHTTFLADRFVVCTFVPRPFETDPGAHEGAVLPQQRRLRRSVVLSRGRFLQPRQHSSRHDHAASRRLHARPASQGAEERAPAVEARHRRIRGDDRHARRAGNCAGGRAGGMAGLRGQLEERSSHETGDAQARRSRRAPGHRQPRPHALPARARHRAHAAGGAR